MCTSSRKLWGEPGSVTELQETAWDRLVIEGEEAGRYVRLRSPDIRACAAYAARRTTDGHEAIILEVRKDAIPAGVQYPESRGFTVAALPVEEGRTGHTRLVLSLADVVYRDVFLTLASDVLETLPGARTEGEAVEAFISRLERWQAFLRQHGPEGLSAEARRGLYGELVVLRDHLLPALGDAAVPGWKGPAGAAHDFQLLGGSVEVKTTTAATPGEFRVSNVLQLDESHARVLYLALVTVQESESAGENLPGIVSSIRNSLGGAALETFADRLVDAGYLARHLYLCDSPKYSLRATQFFEVTGDFPRLLESAIPRGVTGVAYRVSVGSCLSYLREERNVTSSLIGEAEGE
jgi:hypothetical protein